MTQYREILRLHSQGISQRSIALSCSCSRNTVAKVIKKATELELTWNQCSGKTDAELEELIKARTVVQRANRKHPDLEYLHKEMAKPGVTLKLLWTEYCSQCRTEWKLPLMYSQFCHHYQQFAQTKRATITFPENRQNKSIWWLCSPDRWLTISGRVAHHPPESWLRHTGIFTWALGESARHQQNRDIGSRTKRNGYSGICKR